MSRQMEQLDADIEAMEARMTGTTSSKETASNQTEGVKEDEQKLQELSTSQTESPSQEELSGPDDEGEDETEESDGQEHEQGQPAKNRNNWKKRYTSLRSHHDAQMYELRSELSRMKSSVVDLKKSNAALASQVHSIESGDNSFITEEERAILGDDAVNVLMKVNEKTVKPLKDQLAAEQSARLKAEELDALKAQEVAKGLFVQRLERLVPNYPSIDTDPRFLNWMNDQDEWSGVERKVLFQRAVANGDVGRAAEFYVTFYNLTTKVPKDNLADKITPTGSSNSAVNHSQHTPQGSEVISMQFIDNFFNDVARGRYKGRLALQQEIEAKIDKAVAEGKVRR